VSVLSVEPLHSVQDGNGLSHFGAYLKGNLPLFLRSGPDRHLILQDLLPVNVRNPWVLHKPPNDLLVSKRGGYELHTHGLGMPIASTHAIVGRGQGRASRVANRCSHYPWNGKPVRVQSPESSAREHGRFRRSTAVISERVGDHCRGFWAGKTTQVWRY